MQQHVNDNSPKIGLSGQLTQCWKMALKIATNVIKDFPQSIRAGRSGAPSLSEQIKELEENKAKLEQEAITDDLTGLPNNRASRKQLIDFIETVRHQRDISLVVGFADLDDLKKANKARGHAHGDMLIKTLSDRLKNGLRHNDFLGRLKMGDEFLILGLITNEGHSSQNGASKFKDKVIEKQRHLDLETGSENPKFSIGFSEFNFEFSKGKPIGFDLRRVPTEKIAEYILLKANIDLFRDKKERKPALPDTDVSKEETDLSTAFYELSVEIERLGMPQQTISLNAA